MFSQRKKHFVTLQNTNKECEDYDFKNQITKVKKIVLNLTRKIIA